jgi:hypothetical protein
VRGSARGCDKRHGRGTEDGGKAARDTVSRKSHGQWSEPAGRADPVGVPEQQGARRLPELLPIRYGRMAASPFAFLRGSAAIMAADLAATPRSDLATQLCGDAHLSNFASPRPTASSSLT